MQFVSISSKTKLDGYFQSIFLAIHNIRRDMFPNLYRFVVYSKSHKAINLYLNRFAMRKEIAGYFFISVEDINSHPQFASLKLSALQTVLINTNKYYCP
jgi:hypothetical protein